MQANTNVTFVLFGIVIVKEIFLLPILVITIVSLFFVNCAVPDTFSFSLVCMCAGAQNAHIINERNTSECCTIEGHYTNMLDMIEIDNADHEYRIDFIRKVTS
jgi:hypothetical protein